MSYWRAFSKYGFALRPAASECSCARLAYSETAVAMALYIVITQRHAFAVLCYMMSATCFAYILPCEVLYSTARS